MNREVLETILDTRCPSHSGILAGVCKGDKWICQDGDSVLAVTYSYCVGGCAIFGSIVSHEAAERLFAEVFACHKQNELDEFEFSCEDDKLEKWVLEYFNKQIQTELEFSYRYLNKEIAPIPLNDGNADEFSREYAVLPIDKQLTGSLSAYENADLLEERMIHSWEQESFFRDSVGFVAVNNNRLIGIIFGSGRYREFLSIDIEVEEQYRRRGVASELTNRFIAECQKRNIVPQWDCVASNIASQRLAEKSGFELIRKRPYYWFEI